MNKGQKYFIEPGEVYGYLTVIKLEPKIKNKKRMYKCICKCGKETYAEAWALKTGNKKSCGCIQREIVSARVIHGACKNKAQTGLYRTYRKMLARCYNKKQHCYNNYGGRGITVCEEWKKGFIYFKEWAYEKGNYNESISHLTIDRIDNDGNYEPSNCQFLTNSENVKKAWRDRKERDANTKANKEA